MQVRVNTDRHLDGTEAPAARVTGDLEDALTRSSERLTRVEVHLGDISCSKAGARNKRCMLAARLKGHDPKAVAHAAESLDRGALAGAIDKRLAALEHRVGRRNANAKTMPRRAVETS